jgi:ribonuclease G
MSVTLLISQGNGYRRVAYLKNNHLIDLDLEFSAPFPCLDQLYWGRVVQVTSSHAFVKLTQNSVGLLPLDSQKLHEGQAVLVQVKREAIPDKGTQNKGPLLTQKIVLGGRYCLFYPFQKENRISAKIKDKAIRTRLQTFLKEEEEGITQGFTLRQAAAYASLEDIRAEIIELRSQFCQILALKAPCSVPSLGLSWRWMRDLEVEETHAILVDHEEALSDVRTFLKMHRPDLLVQRHRSPLFEVYDLEERWDSLFQEVVPLPNGGNIVIEVTAAAIVVDVNEGQDGHTNTQAIVTLVQQIKWRALGGNIIIDFIGLGSQDRDHLKGLLQETCASYGLPLEIFGWSRLGWMEVRLPKRRLPLQNRWDLASGKG